jgi:hypothetical protein
MDFIALYSVETAIVAPLLARRGQILTVWPASATHTLSVCSLAAGYPVVRYCSVPMGKLYGMVLEWENDGVIKPLSAADALFSARSA